MRSLSDSAGYFPPPVFCDKRSHVVLVAGVILLWVLSVSSLVNVAALTRVIRQSDVLIICGVHWFIGSFGPVVHWPALLLSDESAFPPCPIGAAEASLFNAVLSPHCCSNCN